MTVQDPIIAIQLGDERIVFVGTPEEHVIQSDNREYVKTAKASMERVQYVPLIQGMPYKTFPTGKSTFLEITASLASANAGQAVILTAPQEVLDALAEVRGVDVPGAIY